MWSLLMISTVGCRVWIPRSRGCVNGSRILTPFRHLGSRARRNTADHLGRVDHEAWTQTQTRCGVGVLETRAVGCGHGRGVPDRRDYSQDRLSVADGTRRPSAARLAEDARSGRYLSLLERQRIATLRERGLGVRQIADRLGRAPSTVSRELRRNTVPLENWITGYDVRLCAMPVGLPEAG